VTVNVWPPIDTVPVRTAASAFAPTATLTLPFPLPLAPLAIVSHAAFAVAVHAHVAVTPIVGVAPSAAMFALVGDSAIVHGGGGAAAWLTVNVCPPIVTVPLRAAPLFAAAATVTLPLPVPLAPAGTVSHGAFAVAVHAHEDADAVTATVAVPASAASVALGGAMLNVQGAGGAALCVIVTVRPATVSVVDRSPPLFAATV
jgi:hypothetical protein